MKKVICMFSMIAACLALTTSALAQAAGPKGGAPGGQAGERRQQGPGGGRMGGMRMSEEMMAKLSLSAAQKQKMEALQKKMQAEMKALMDGNKGDREAMRDKVMPMMKKYREDMNKILTKAQQAKLEALRKEMMEKRRKDGFGGAGAPGAGAKPGSKKGGGG